MHGILSIFTSYIGYNIMLVLCCTIWGVPSSGFGNFLCDVILMRLAVVAQVEVLHGFGIDRCEHVLSNIF